MDILNNIIELMNKEEQRSFKLFAGRFRDRDDRKDVRLFQYVRRSGAKYNERKIIRELYGPNGKNAFYRLKNRLLTEVGKSMAIHHAGVSEEMDVYHFLSLAILYRDKHASQVTEFFLKKAEKKARNINNLEMLDLIYGEFITLSFSLTSINPEKYIQMREENRETLNRFREIDNVLAAVSYRIRITQNFAQKDNSVVDLLRKTVNEFSLDLKVKENPRFRFRIYEAVSKILLQNREYLALEEYLRETFHEFNRDKLFERSNHDIRLQMLTYLINALWKNQKYQESLEYAEKLKDAMQMFNNLLYEKYLFFYYNSLANNYFELDVKKAIQTLQEMLEIREIVKVPLYEVFVSMNLAVFFLKTGDFDSAIKQVVKTRLRDNFKTIDPSMKIKFDVFEQMVRFEMGDFEVIEYRLNQIWNDYEELLADSLFEADAVILGLFESMIKVPKLKDDARVVRRIQDFIKNHPPKDTDFFNYGEWLDDKLKGK